MEEAKLVDDPVKAQKMADALHIAACDFDTQKARETVEKSRFTVREAVSGIPYDPPPLVKNKWVFDREKN
jgi:hypothetical protein